MTKCEDAVTSPNILKNLKTNTGKGLRIQRHIYGGVVCSHRFGLRESDGNAGQYHMEVNSRARQIRK